MTVAFKPTTLDAWPMSPENMFEPIQNQPSLWLADFPVVLAEGHKYSRGHLLCVSGPMLRTGASRLAALAGLRIGAGLVTLASPPDALAVNAAHLTAIMLVRMDGAPGLVSILADQRISALVIGPALGLGETTGALIMAALEAGRPCVLDADALTQFSANPSKLFGAIKKAGAPVIMTPHKGEFVRLFPDLLDSDAIAMALAAAEQSGAVLVLKGPLTIIAGPGGRLVVNKHASPNLATAGSGDVLAGMIGGLLAQDMPAFEAACAGVWIHGDAGLRLGRGLIAEDFPGVLPVVLSALQSQQL